MARSRSPNGRGACSEYRMRSPRRSVDRKSRPSEYGKSARSRSPGYREPDRKARSPGYRNDRKAREDRDDRREYRSCSRDRQRAPSEPRNRSRSRENKPAGRESKKSGFKWKKTDQAPVETRPESKAHVTAPALEERADLSSKFGADYETAYARPQAEAPKAEPVPEKKKKSKKDKGPRPTAEPMIRVFVNDRLGTRAEIPCLASDPLKLFKAQVAQRIGRRPHEILIKRQSERPFKDHLTLEDYGVVNGVSLDLEVDTGD